MQECNEKMASRSFAYLYLSSFFFFLFVSPCHKIDRLSSQTVGELNPGKHLIQKLNFSFRFKYVSSPIIAHNNRHYKCNGRNGNAHRTFACLVSICLKIRFNTLIWNSPFNQSCFPKKRLMRDRVKMVYLLNNYTFCFFS